MHYGFNKALCSFWLMNAKLSTIIIKKALKSV